MDNLSQDLDLDLFGWIDVSWTDTEEETLPEEDVSTTPDEEVEETTDVPTEWDTSTAEDVPADTTDELDIDALVEQILNESNEVDDKVEEIKQEANTTGNEELLNMIDELQTLLAEKNQQIAELNKKDEITSGRLMDTYGDAENYSFYKWTINKLEENPQLMSLVKNYNSDNEKAQERVISILSDMIFEKTGEDISNLINTNQKNKVSNALTDVDWWWEVGNPAPQDEEQDLNYNQSINDLF